MAQTLKSTHVSFGVPCGSRRLVTSELQQALGNTPLSPIDSVSSCSSTPSGCRSPTLGYETEAVISPDNSPILKRKKKAQQQQQLQKHQQAQEQFQKKREAELYLLQQHSQPGPALWQSDTFKALLEDMSESDVEGSCLWGARKPGHGLVWPPNKPPVSKEDAVPPWAKQEATAPPPPSAHGNLYSTWSPKSQNKAVTGAEESVGDSKSSKMASPMAQRKTLPRTDSQKKGAPIVPESSKLNGLHNPSKGKGDTTVLQNGESNIKNETKTPQTISTKSVKSESSTSESTIKKTSLTETKETSTTVTKISASNTEKESTKSESSKLISKSESSKTESESSKISMTSSSSSTPQSNEQVAGNGPGGATGAPSRGGQTAKGAATANLQHDASKGTKTTAATAESGQPQSGVDASQVSSANTSEVKTGGGGTVISGVKVPAVTGDNTPQVSDKAKAMVATKPGAKETKDKTGAVGQLQRQEQQPPWRRSQEQLNTQPQQAKPAQQPKVEQLKQDQPPWRKSQEQLNKVSQDAPWRSKSRENLLSRSQEKLLTSSKENLVTEGTKQQQKQENKQEPPPWRKAAPGGGPRAGGSPGGEGKAGPPAEVAESSSNKQQIPAAPSPPTAPLSATVKASPSAMAIKAAGLTKRDVVTPAKEEAKTTPAPTTAPSAVVATAAGTSVTPAALTDVDAKLAAAEASVKTTTTTVAAPRVLVPTTATTTAPPQVPTAVPAQQPTAVEAIPAKSTPDTQILVEPTHSAPTTTTGDYTATTNPSPVPTAIPAAPPAPNAPPLPTKQGLSPTAPPVTAPKPLAPPRGASLQVLAKSPSSPLAAPTVAQSTVLPEPMAPPPPPITSQVSPSQPKTTAAANITPPSVAALSNGHSSAAVTTTTTGAPPPLPPPPAAAEGPKLPTESIIEPMSAGEEDDKTYAKEVLHSVLTLVPTETPTEKPVLTPTAPPPGPEPLEFPPPPPLFETDPPAAAPSGSVTDTETSEPSALQPLVPYLAEKPEPAFPIPPSTGPVEDTMTSEPSALLPLVPQQSVEPEPTFPSPPPPVSLNLEGPKSAPVEAIEPESPEYVKESVTQRVKRFNSQRSQEYEKPKDQQMPPPKPVAPWVTKTSDEQRASPVRTLPKPPGPPPKPKSPASSSKDNVSSISMVLQHPPSGRDQAKNDSISKGTPPPAAPAAPSAASSIPAAASNRILSRQRTDSTGELTTDYLETDRQPLPKMPADGQVAPIPSPATAQPPSSTKNGDPTFDAWCDPANPRIIQFQDVSAAAFKIKSGIMNTPCTRSHMSSFTGMPEIFFKKEFNQYTGSFKERGARYALLMLSEEQKRKGVIAASAGNHALALCYHGQDLGIPVTVVMPLVAPIMKVQSCKQYGANIIVKGNDIGESRELALKIGQEEGRLYINGYDHPHILAGQGTMGLEIVEQVPNIDAVVIPCGGGGLIAGVALAVKALYPNCMIIGAESERCASFSEAMKAGKPVYVKAESTLADGLAVPKIGVNAFATARTLVDKVVTVKEEWIAIAILRLVENEKAVVEGAGATALAAVLAGELPELSGKRVVIPLCGGNIDTTVLGRCLDRGLAADGRLVKFTVTVSDRPGGIAELTRLLANLGVSIKDMLHERAWIRNDIFSVEVKVLAETRDSEHCLELQNALESRYKFVRFVSQDTVHADAL